MMMALFLLIVFSATSLRPIADDYCHGAVASDGFLNGVSTWLTTWTGAMYPVLTGVLFVGLPLAVLPLGVSSAVGFIVASLIVGFLAVSAFGFGWKKKIVANIASTLIVSISWILHLRIVQVVETRPGDMPSDSVGYQLAEILTHWQTVNIGYVFGPALAMIFLSYGFFGPFRYPWLRLITIFLSSILVGQSGYVFGGTWVIVFLVLAILFWLRGQRVHIKNFGIGILGVIFGLVSGFFFPGSAARADSIGTDLISSIPGAIRATPNGLFQWATETFSLTTLVVLALGGFFYTIVARRRSADQDQNRAKFLPPVLLFASLVFYVLNEAMEEIVYGAVWHSVPARLMTFIAIFMLGSKAMEALRLWTERRRGGGKDYIALEIAHGLIISWLLVIAAAVLSSNIEERESAWELGPAGYDFVDDREAGWVETCWQDLEETMAS